MNQGLTIRRSQVHSKGMPLPQRLFFGWLVWTFVLVGLLEKYYQLPVAIIWAGMYGLNLLLFLLWLWSEQSRPRLRIPVTFVWLILLSALVIVISGLLYQSNLFGLAIRLRDQFKYVLLFFPMAALFTNERAAQGTVKLAAAILLLQTPLVALQFVFEANMGPADTTAGTFGIWGTGELMLLVAYATAVTVSMVRSRWLKRRQGIFFVGWLLPIIPMTGANAGVIFVPLAGLLGYLGIGQRRWNKRLAAILLLVVLPLLLLLGVGANDWIAERAGNFGAMVRWSITMATAEVADSSGNPGRVVLVERTLGSLQKPSDFWFGKGIDSGVGSFEERIDNRSSERRLALAVQMSITDTLTQSGLVGLTLFLTMVAAWSVTVYRKRSAFQTPFWRGIYGAYFACLLIWLLAGFYNAAWSSTWSSFPFWFLSALLIGHAQARRRMPTSSSSGQP